MKIRSILIAIMAVLVLTGCTKKVATYEQTVEDGIRITKNTGVPADSTFKIELKEVGFIDMENETDSLKRLAYPESFDFDNGGNLYIFDGEKQMIHKYDNKITFVSAFGGIGQGPGEFLNGGFIIIKKDTMIISDSRLRKLNKLDLDGKFISDKKFIDYEKSPWAPAKFGPKYISRFYGSISKEGKVYELNTMSVFDQKFDFEKMIYENKTEQRGRSVEYDPTAEGIVSAAGEKDLFVYENSKTDYKIDVYDLKCEKVRQIQKNFARVKNSSEAMKEEDELNKQYGTNYKIEYLNSISNMYTDKKGRLWVRSAVEGIEDLTCYDIFENDVFLNRVKIKVEDGYFIVKVGEKIIAVNDNNNIKIYEY